VKTALSPETLRYPEYISGRLKVSFGLTKEFSGFKVVIQGVSEATSKRKRLQIL